MMKITVLATALLVCATVVRADDRKFSAADMPHVVAMKKGRVVISNDADSITAFKFLGNFQKALFSLQTTRRVVASPVAAVFNPSARLNVAMPAEISALLAEAGRTHNVDPRLIAAVVRRESGFNPRATSRVGAGGLMQLMPATAKYLGVRDLYDPRQNVFAGAKYLRTLLDTFNGDLNLTLAAYNAGPGAVQKYNGIPPYKETRAYVVAVRSNYEKYLRAGI